MKKFLKKVLKISLATACVVVAIICVEHFFDPFHIKQLITPTPTVIKSDPAILIQEIQKLARLETAAVNSEQIIRGKRDQDRLGGIFGETMTLVAYGQAIAGIDLSKFKENDINQIDSDTIEIRLPEAEIFNVIIDNEKSYIESSQKGILAKKDKDLETKLRQKAQTECQKNAIDLGILDIATRNAKSFIRDFLQKQGFKDVVFVNILTDEPIA